MTEKLKLVTSKFSPYGHRVEMALLEKGLNYEKQDIDLSNKPEWFIKESPLGKAPILYVGNNILFESIVICEYLDELFPQNPLHSKDPIIKANHRSWMEYSSGMLASIFGMIFATDQESFDIKKAETMAKLAIFDKNIKFNPYFDGDKFLMIDICMASVFRPLYFIDNKFTLEIFDLYKSTATYVESLVTRGSLQKSIPDNYDEIFRSFLERKNSHLLSMSFSL